MELLDNEETEERKGEFKKSNIVAWAEKSIWTGFGAECKKILLLSTGLMVGEVVRWLMQPMATIFAGHLGQKELNAVALANSVINATGSALASSAAGACDTFFAQVYGSSNKKYLGVQLQKSIIIFFLIYLVCISIQINFKHIFFKAGVDPIVTSLCAQYLETFAPGLLFMFLFIVMRKYVEVHNVVVVHVVISIIGLASHAAAQYLLLYYYHFGVRGSAIAMSFAYLVMLLCLILYIIFSGLYKETYAGLDKRCLLDWGEFFRLAFASLIMSCLEWWVFEAIIFIAGTRGNDDLAVQTILFNTELLFYGFLAGMATASCIRIGQSLGGNDVIGARRCAVVGVILTGIVTLLMTTLILSLGQLVPRIFTSSQTVLDLASDMMPVFILYFICANCSAAYRRGIAAVGRQSFGAIVNALSYLCVLLPVGLSLWFTTSMGIKGMWLGFFLGALCLAVSVFVYMAFWVNWTVLAKQAVIRARAENKNSNNNIEHSTDDSAINLQEIDTNANTNDASKSIQCSDESSSLISRRDSVSSAAVLRTTLITFVVCSIFIAAVLCSVLIPTPDISTECSNTSVYACLAANESSVSVYDREIIKWNLM